jgi:NRPS condensation-like uncharacterized protein
MNESAKNFWLPLDNAAKIYPAVRNNEQTAVFRISAVLKDNIRINVLYTALKELENRFPYYKVVLKKGFFWYFLEYKNLPFPVEPDTDLPCRGFKTNKDSMMRILVLRNSISVEFSHILTDGSGGLAFLKSVLLTYFKNCGYALPADLEYHKPDEEPSGEEFEDAYQRYFQKNLPYVPGFAKAFHLPFKLKKKPRFTTMIILLPLGEVYRSAKDKKVSITVYLVAVYLWALQEIFQRMDRRGQRKAEKILRIQVPVNLRSLYHSKTMRNFSLFVMPEIDLRLGNYTFDEILAKTYYLMKLETDQKLINKIISRNVGGEKRPEVRGAPLFLKSLVLNYKYRSLGARLYSGVITNLGKVDLSPELNKLIDYFVFTAPPPNQLLKVNCGVVGFEDRLVMSFGNISVSTELERKFLGFLESQDIKAEIV